MKYTSKLIYTLIFMLGIGFAIAQPVSGGSAVMLGYQEFPIASIDNMFIPFSNPSLLGTGNANGVGLAYLNDNAKWQNHYWLFANGKNLSYIYENDHDKNYHTLATGFQLFPANLLPNFYAGTNYHWAEGAFEDGLFRSSLTYRPYDAASMAFTWDNPMGGKPYYRGGLALRPLAYLKDLEAHRLELSLDANYAPGDDGDYQIFKPILGVQTELLDGIKFGGTYNLEEETALFNFSIRLNKIETGGLLRTKDLDDYGIAWLHATDLNFKPFLGITPPKWYDMKLGGKVLSYRAPKYEIGPIKLYDSKDKSIESIIATLNKAKDDPAIDGILLKNPSFSTSLALQQELITAFKNFKFSGKQLSFYYDNIGNAGYIFAASIADKIYLNPMGSIDLRGLAISSPYLKNLLSTLGIETMNFRSHKYKNAGNMFSETEMTEAEREVYSSILDSFWAEMVKSLDEGRGSRLSESASKIIENGPYYLATDALNKGLVDKLIYEDELNKQLKKDFSYSRSVASLDTYRSYDWSQPKETQIAVIYASGNIVMGKGTPGTKIAHASTVKMIREARTNKAYKGIILRVDSGGGSAQASDIILRELELAQTENKLPVVVSMAGVAGSGGYYIACKADKIVADPSTITGSIGVIGLAFNATEMFKKIKVNWSTVKKGPNADLGSLNRPWTDDEKAMMTRFIEHTYEDFVGKVDAGRPTLNLEQVHQYAQGRIWTGSQAFELGLIDELGGLDVAAEEMRELAGIKGKMTLVDATSSISGIKIDYQGGLLNSIVPLKALETATEDYIQLYELWNDFADDKALMLSPDVPELIQF